MTIAHIIILLGTGAVVGFASGLLGSGGGFIMTPVQYMIFTNMGMSTKVAMMLAFGTSLLVILPTVISGAWRHHKKGAVRWKAAIIMGICGFMSSFGGAAIAANLSGTTLKMAFGVVVLASGVRMLISKPREREQEAKDKPWLLAAWAIPIGIVTGMTGLGGGVVAVPVMVLALKFKMHNAIATSLAMMILTSCGGVIEGENAWRYRGPRRDPYVQEHTDLLKSIRDGKPLNEGERIAGSTLCAIMGRESAYSRQQFKRSWFMNRCTLDLLPPGASSEDHIVRRGP